jgi:hypothetical protein
MSYTKLTNVADVDSLLGSLRTFLSGDGWGILQDLISPGSGSPNEGSSAGGRKLVVTKGDCLAGIRSAVTGTGGGRLYLFDGIPDTSPIVPGSYLDQLPGNSGIRVSNSEYTTTTVSARCWNAAAGPFPNVWFFSNAAETSCHVVAEVSSGVFHHMLFGVAEKFGTWTGGGYYACTQWDQTATFINSPASNNHQGIFDSATGAGASAGWTLHCESGNSPNVRWMAPSGTDLASVAREAGRGNGRGGLGGVFANIDQTPFSGVIGLAPILLLRQTAADDPDTFHLVARIPDVRLVNMTNLVPGQEYILGSDTWTCFPLRAKNGASGQNSSGVYGLAYKKVT